MATKESEPTYPIFMEWTQCNTDPTSYKQLSPTLHPLNMQVKVDVPQRMFVSYDENAQAGVLTPEGMAYASRQIAIAISHVYAKES